MSNTTITASITYPKVEIDNFADNLGYQTMVVNPDYVPPVGSPTIPDPTWEGNAGDAPEVANPHYVEPVGEPTIANPETREDFVKRLFKEMAVKWFTQFAERDITRMKSQEAAAAIDQVKNTVKSAINI